MHPRERFALARSIQPDLPNMGAFEQGIMGKGAVHSRLLISLFNCRAVELLFLPDIRSGG
jgi:hypothetical protein